MPAVSERVAGRVARAHGLRGEVSVEVLTSVPEARFAVGVQLEEVDGARTFTVRSVRPHQGRLLVTFEGVDDRTAAEALRGVLLAGTEDIDPPEGEVWAAEIQGFAVVGTDGESLGTVVEVVANPAHELLLVTREEGADVLVPMVEEFVVEMDEEGRRIVVDPPEGLF